MNKYLQFLIDPDFRFSILASRGVYDAMPDDVFLRKKFKLALKKELDLENPKTFNEKLQWLKIHDRNPEYTRMVDKHEVKKYVAERIGEQYIIPTLGVWDSFDEIDFDALPDQFVLKTTHDSGGVVICRDKSHFDIKMARKKIQKSYRRDYFYQWREWPYKNVKPRIIAEKYMQDRDYETLNVFKIFNFNGEAKIIQMIQGDKTKAETIDYFDTKWNRLDLRQNFPNSSNPLEKPKTLEEMLRLASILAKDAPPFIRTDFYEINGEVYFSEFTFYSDFGLARFYPEEWDKVLGSWIDLTV